MDTMDEDFFDETDADFGDGPAPLKRGDNAVAELYDYISEADWKNHDPQLFAQLLQCARQEIKDRNFKSEGEGTGLLNYEQKVFVRLFKKIPFWTSMVAAVLVAGISSAFLMSGSSDTVVVADLIKASGVSLFIAVLMIGAAAAWRFKEELVHYVIGNRGEMRLRNTRDYNVHIIERTLNELSGVVAERAVNEEPLKGAAGLIQSNLTFMAEYNIRKAIKRCRTLFNIKIEEVEKPDIDDTKRSWGAAVFASLAATVIAVFTVEMAFGAQTDRLTIAAPFLGFMVLPTLTGLLVQSWAAHAATKPGSFMDKRWELLKQAYEPEPSDEFMSAAGYRRDERDRVDFSYDMAPERVHTHAHWLLETLTRYEKLKNRRMMD